jgi:hypothetical protein
MSQVQYKLREFGCKGCGNECSIQEFNVEGEKTFWGDKCSDRFRKQAKSKQKASIPDLIALRRELLFADAPETVDANAPTNAPTIGIPLAMYTWDYLPAWRRFFHDCGFNVVVSQETNRQTVNAGLEHAVAEPCFPIIVAHGHVAELSSAGSTTCGCRTSSRRWTSTRRWRATCARGGRRCRSWCGRRRRSGTGAGGFCVRR